MAADSANNNSRRDSSSSSASGLQSLLAAAANSASRSERLAALASALEEMEEEDEEDAEEYYGDFWGISSPLDFPPQKMTRVLTILFFLDDEELTCNVCDRAFSTPRMLERHQQKKRHWG